MEALTLTLFI